MEFEEFRQRVQHERRVRARRDAVEKKASLERLRREIREAYARASARDVGDDDHVGVPPIPIRGVPPTPIRPTDER